MIDCFRRAVENYFSTINQLHFLIVKEKIRKESNARTKGKLPPYIRRIFCYSGLE